MEGTQLTFVLSKSDKVVSLTVCCSDTNAWMRICPPELRDMQEPVYLVQKPSDPPALLYSILRIALGLDPADSVPSVASLMDKCTVRTDVISGEFGNGNLLIMVDVAPPDVVNSMLELQTLSLPCR